MSNQINLLPIAFVRSKFETNTPAEEMRLETSQIVVEPEFAAGLLGLEPGTDILVLFHFHRIEPDEIELQLHPRHNPANPVRGVFATRSQFRPNRLGVTVAHIEAVAGNVITVSGLDAQDGTPVLDLKPFVPYFDTATVQQQFEVREVNSLAEARAAIDLIDAEIIRLLGNRAGFVRQVVRFKQTAEDVRAPARYVELLRRRRELAEAAGLDPDVIEGMYKLLVDNFIKEELELLQLKE
jgi:tRNA-Thr(GGU) m(6)t(6)A37 methyltransferase TsaA